ncbi:hypothetical protein RHCRD62_80062 [Rhodococcus sp. RD6.2]|nr:hypothetical protein RHCRD62_80062 [Rhodococcus sp. RD6.2]
MPHRVRRRTRREGGGRFPVRPDPGGPVPRPVPRIRQGEVRVRSRPHAALVRILRCIAAPLDRPAGFATGVARRCYLPDTTVEEARSCPHVPSLVSARSARRTAGSSCPSTTTRSPG